jgi:hypothetical protein
MCAQPFHLGVGSSGIVRHSGPNEFIMLDDIASFMKSIASFPFRFGVIRV